MDQRKTWWQHAEAIIALSMCNDTYAEELAQLETFYFSSFQDPQNKGEFFYLDSTNHPNSTELKGSTGKSIYHTTEMIRFLMEHKCL